MPKRKTIKIKTKAKVKPKRNIRNSIVDKATVVRAEIKTKKNG